MLPPLTERMLEAGLLAGLGDTWAQNPTLSDETLTNCVIFGHDVVVQALGAQFSALDFSRMMLRDASEPFSPVNVLVDMGLADEGSQSLPIEGWYAWQLWRSLDPLRGGHFGFAWRKPDGRTAFMDATSADREWYRISPDRDSVASMFSVPPQNVRCVLLR